MIQEDWERVHLLDKIYMEEHIKELKKEVTLEVGEPRWVLPFNFTTVTVKNEEGIDEQVIQDYVLPF